jgi:hypothetical protein
LKAERRIMQVRRILGLAFAVGLALFTWGCGFETSVNDNKSGSSQTVVVSPASDTSVKQDPAELHVISVGNGLYPPGTDTRPWWAKCKDDPAVTSDKDCHEKYSGIHAKSFVTVNITYTAAPVILALMGSEPVEWTVNVDPAVKLKRVILAGQYKQEIKGIDKSIPIEIYNHQPFSCENCTQVGRGFYGYDVGTGDYMSAMKRLHKITGKLPSSVQLTQNGETFYVSPTVKPYSELPAEFKRWERWS